jgi:glycosyltransferase involved in cell wall biosynthesis
LIDVILPTIGRPSLEAAIESVLAQTYQNFQLYVVCDGWLGWDDQHFYDDPRIHKILLDGPNKDSGATARRLGIASGNNPWVCYVDCDDQLLNFHIESLMNLAVKDACDMVHSYGQQFKFSRGRKKVSGVIVKDPTTVSMLHSREIYNRSCGWIDAPNHDHILWNNFKGVGGKLGVLPVTTYHFYRGKR